MCYELAIENEVSIVIFREEKGHIDFSVGSYGIRLDLGVQTCEIEDVLIEREGGVKRYLARSIAGPTGGNAGKSAGCAGSTGTKCCGNFALTAVVL